MALYGESGFDVRGDAADIYGAVTTIQGDRITIDLAGITYSALPRVEEGLISFEQMDFDRHIAGFLTSLDAFADGLESGINNAMMSNKSRMASVALEDGGMVVTFDNSS